MYTKTKVLLYIYYISKYNKRYKVYIIDIIYTENKNKIIKNKNKVNNKKYKNIKILIKKLLKF